ncbi:MAG: AAA family ATPase, partial [Candidatus Diapherotrites archaeon]|nr:AAA family ATPase [Candidatus Diapherotrites archaeon]
MKNVIVISGHAGSGKSTLGKRLAEKYGFRYLAGGYAFAQVLSSHGGPEWWESEEGKNFMKDRESNLRFDAEVDVFLKREAEKGNVVMDG